ncbi:uncharacterized protein LOC129264888 [Lytechinus pictus]|uniref:uncharacterized protein LOC129264888 n=1 Tax=Lytechinus pictus TaxID=7653 RepID=UPI00240DB156|nr:uncharacterized protein LOC129264888 [Lytechinus pictus]
MATQETGNNQPTTVAPSGGLSTDTIIIIVGAVAGTLFLLVIIMLCVVGCIYYRNSKRDDDQTKTRHEKKSKKHPVEPRDRIFRPVDWNDPEGPDARNDLGEIDQILFEESRSRKGSIAMRNPAYKEDDDEVISDNNGYPYRMSNGAPPRPPNLEMLPPERRHSSKSNASTKPSLPPSSPTESTQISILDMKHTWGEPDLTADIDNGNQVNRSRSNSHMNTVSGPHNDPNVDFSVFGGGTMPGSGMQQSRENTLRRSFRSRNQAIVDFYESGYSNSMGARSAASLPMSRMDYQNDSDDKPDQSSGWGTGNRLLWQKRQFVS